MKRKFNVITLALALVFCVGILAACTDNSTDNSTDSGSSGTSDPGTTDTSSGSSGTDTSSGGSGEEQDLVGEVSYAGTSELTLKLCETVSDVTDYAALDISTLTDSGKTSTVTIQDDAQFFCIDSGEECSAAQEDIVVGSVIAVTTSDSGSQKIIILNDAGTEDTIVARVAEVNEDGTLSLSLYTLTDSAADYSIADYADVELGNYEDSCEALEYGIGEDTVLQVSKDGVLEDAASTDIVAGDMLVIYTDDSGSDAIVIFRADRDLKSDRNFYPAVV